MKNIEFKVGDKVKRVWGEHCGMNAGDIGTIEYISKNGINIREFGGLEWNHEESSFIKIDNEEAVRTGRKFKIGDKVRVIKNLSDYPGDYLVGEVGIINEIDSNPIYPYRIDAIGTHGTNWRDEELELIKDIDIKEIKTNRIKRVNDEGKETQIEYDIIDNKIKFKISEESIHITTLLKILLNASELYNYEYERISPYKIERRYINGTHEFAIDFIDVKNDFKHHHNVLLTTDKDMKMYGKYSLFIPDFLGLCVERNILDYDGKRFSVKRDIDSVMGNCKYIPCKPSIGMLKNQGYIIPKYYKEL